MLHLDSLFPFVSLKLLKQSGQWHCPQIRPSVVDGCDIWKSEVTGINQLNNLIQYQVGSNLIIGFIIGNFRQPYVAYIIELQKIVNLANLQPRHLRFSVVIEKNCSNNIEIKKHRPTPVGLGQQI